MGKAYPLLSSNFPCIQRNAFHTGMYQTAINDSWNHENALGSKALEKEVFGLCAELPTLTADEQRLGGITTLCIPYWLSPSRDRCLLRAAPVTM
ncbi:hypothetical protein I79_013738 [Cricetulus griseus]|uniref:Uncharacterized protein n=1 Tax=Cricetulus griseus TaxID=10029 RepID=G3HSA9_CRIGR|nr:hypothetical protein I79_013738 [Cricetulus griseus]